MSSFLVFTQLKVLTAVQIKPKIECMWNNFFTHSEVSNILVHVSTLCRFHSLRTLHMEGADSMRLKGQMRGNQECPSKGITNHG